MTRPAARIADPEIDAQLIEEIASLVDAGARGDVLRVIAELHPADVARLVSRLPRDEAHVLFDWLPAETGAEVLTELDDTLNAELLEEAARARIKALIDELDTDDAADVLACLDDDVIEQVLPMLEDADDIQKLLTYDEETAGGIMGTELVAVPPDWTVAEATEEVRRNAETVEELFVVFVVDAAERLVGFVSLKRLLLSPSESLIGSVMRSDVLSVTTDIDQEEVVRIMERYDLVSLAVVNDDVRLVGRITIDDVIDVFREEAEEDYQRLSGITGDEGATDSVARITRGRLPWLFLGMVGAAIAGSVIGVFEETIRRVSILAAFIPVVMAMAGNAGIQSSAIMVQGLASGDVWSSNLMRRLGKEVVVAVVNGLALAIVIVGVVILVFVSGAEFAPEIVSLTPEPIRLAITAGLSLFVVILLAAGIGTAIPLLLDRVGIDPALATGPFITTSNDIMGLVVFFALATLLYLPFLP